MRFLPDRKEGNDSQSIRKKVQFKAAQELTNLKELETREAEKAARKDGQGDNTGGGNGGDPGNDEP